MMIQIRRGCYETNSSSTHAIIVSEEENFDDSFWPDVTLNVGDFGWEFGVLDTVDEKASYLYTAACIIKKKDVFDDIKEMLAPFGIDCYSTVRAHFCKSIMGYDRIDNGDINHPYLDEFVDYILDSPVNLIRYLFDERSYVVTGNDNCDDIDHEWFEKKTAKADAYRHKTFYKGN